MGVTVFSVKTAGISVVNWSVMGNNCKGWKVLHTWVVGAFQQCSSVAGWLVGYIFTMYLQTDADLTKFVLRDWVLDVYICSDGCIYVSLNFNSP